MSMLAGESIIGSLAKSCTSALGMHVELLGGGFRLVRGGVVVAGGDGTGILGVNGEGDAGAALLRAAFIESAACFEAFRARRQVEGDDAVRVRADAVFDGFSRRCAVRCPSAVGIHAHIAPARLRGLPFDLGEFLLAAIPRTSRGSAQSAQSAVKPFPPSVTTRKSSFAPSSETSMSTLWFGVLMSMTGERKRGFGAASLPGKSPGPKSRATRLGQSVRVGWNSN
jgi:hypothetical protein